MVVNYKIANTTFDVTITLTGITDEVYRDISAYIEERLARADVSNTLDELVMNGIKNFKAEPPAVKCKEAEKEEKKPAIETKKSKAYEDFIMMVYDCKKSPKRYNFVEMTSSEYLSAHPELGDVSAKSIGRLMTTNGLVCGKVSRKSPAGTYGTYNVFYFPVPKRTFGLALREARFESKLSLGEVSQLIGYPKENIKRWEMDEYTPSSEAVEQLKNLFGNDAFANLDE